MRKTYSLWLLLLMVLGSAIPASAFQVQFEWDTPGAIQYAKLGGTGATNPTVDFTDGQNSYLFESEKTFDYIYFYAADGYLLSKISYPDGSTKNPISGGTYWGASFSATTVEKWDNNVVTITTEEFKRDATLTINVENGASMLTGVFSEMNYTIPQLQDGENLVPFSTTKDKTLKITAATSGNEIFSVTRNGEAVTKRFAFSTSYDMADITPDDVINIRVYEEDQNAPKEYTITLDFPGSLTENCINTIRDWTASKFVELEDGKLTVTEGTDIAFNFKEGDDANEFHYDDFLLNGTSITGSNYKESNRQLRFVVSGDCTLSVVGEAVPYAEETFTAIVKNPAGVRLYLGQYQGDNFIDLADAEGTSLSSSVTLPSLTIGDITTPEVTLNTDDSQQYKVKVTSKRPYIFVAPAEGYYILTVQGKEEGKMTVINSASTEISDKKFYVVAMPLEGYSDLKFNVKGAQSLRLASASAILSNWDNPVAAFQLGDGEQTIRYIPDLHLPLSLRSLEQSSTFEGYLDGVKLAPDDNGTLTITPADPTKTSTVTVFNDGVTKGVTGTVTVECAEGLTAETWYSDACHPITLAASGKALLKGTTFTVKPSDSHSTVKLNGEAATLNPAGEFTFTVAAGTNKVEIAAAPKTFEYAAVEPGDGAKVKNISQVSLTMPVLDLGEHMLTTEHELMAGITLTKEGAETLHASELVDAMEDYMTGAYTYVLGFDGVATEAGEWTLTIPAGTFYEVAFTEDYSDLVKVDGGYQAEAYTGTVTVDPAIKGKMEDFTFTPEDGSSVESLDIIHMNFKQYSPMADYIMVDWENEPTITNGTTTYSCMVGPAEDVEDTESWWFMIIPHDDNYEQVAITEPGTWTLNIPAGQFTCLSDSNAPIAASWTIAGATEPSYVLTPASGTEITRIAKITLAFPGATEVEYNDGYITLEGDGFDTSTTGVSYTAYSENHNTFTIQFTSTPIEAGEYTLTVPAGAFTLDGVASEAIIATYSYTPGWRLTPAPGSTVDSFDNITIEFPYATDVTFEGNGQSIMLYTGYYAATSFDCVKVEGTDCPTFRISIDPQSQLPPMTTLSFLIDEGAFTVDGTPSDEIRCYYTYKRDVSIEYQVSPTTSRLIYDEYGAMWAFIFDESASVRVTDSDKLIVKVDGEQLTYGSDFIGMSEANSYMMMITNTDVLTDGAELNVTLEDGALSLSGKTAPLIEVSWILTPAKEHVYEISPDDSGSINDLKTITIGFPEAETGEIYLTSGALLNNNSYTYSQTADITQRGDAQYPTFDLNFNVAPTTADSYKLTVRRGTFTLDEVQESPEIRMTYNFDPTGISSVTISTDGPVNVVTIDGRVVMKDADADALLALPAGIYIINGQKVAVK